MPSHEPLPQGAVMRGNIELQGRLPVPNPAGGASTVYSMSFRDDDPQSPTFGFEVLVPLADEGRILSEDEAINKFYRTGRHLGVFSDPQSAVAYADQLHKDYESGKYAMKPMPSHAPTSIAEHARLYGPKR